MSSANNSQFIQTRKMFRSYLSGYPKNLTFEEWNKADDDDKAALLYVNFYQEVTLAWYNSVVAKGVIYISQEDGVSTVLQYLMKNVSKISEDPERYSAEYVYTVCKNCLLKLWQTRTTEMHRCNVEVSHEFQVEAAGTVLGKNFKEGGTVDYWDLTPSEDDDLETQLLKESIWNIIRHMGPKAEKVVNHLINPSDTLRKVSTKSSERDIDRLADVSVSQAEYDAIIEELKVKLAPFKDVILAS